ncbi:hypothetical protein DFJ73DRAFT_763647 [Zopfochytrium polystomum]|nr:hypothetical protein DFJ73DRAFT_763647 [Zopfochytrium polystomum]
MGVVAAVVLHRVGVVAAAAAATRNIIIIIIAAIAALRITITMAVAITVTDTLTLAAVVFARITLPSTFLFWRLYRHPQQQQQRRQQPLATVTILTATPAVAAVAPPSSYQYQQLRSEQPPSPSRSFFAAASAARSPIRSCTQPTRSRRRWYVDLRGSSSAGGEGLCDAQGQLSSGVTKYPSMYQSFRLILVEEGLRGLYSGVLAATSGSLFSTLLYFGCYEGLKRKLIDSNWNPTAAYFVSGSVHAFWSILEKRGVRGLYYGWGATLLRDVPFTAVQFTLFENARSVFLHRFCGGDESRMKTWHDMASGAFAGVVAGAVTTPLDVCKTYIMTQKQVTPPKKKVTVQRPVNATWIDTPEIAAAASAKNAPPQPPLLNNAVPPSHSSFSPNVLFLDTLGGNGSAGSERRSSNGKKYFYHCGALPTPRPSRTPSPTASKAGKAPAGKGVAGSAVGSSAATTKPPSPSRPRSAAAAVAAASTSSRSASTATAAGAPSAAKAAAEAAAAAAAAATKTAAAAGGTAAAAEMAVPYYSGAIQAFKGIYRRQGMAGLFAGVGPRMVWTGCQSTIMFAV